MQSLRSKMIISLIKNRHLFGLKLKPEVVDESFSPKEFREKISRSTKKIASRIPEDVTVKSVDINGMYGEWIVPKGASEGNVLLYIHGGGFISGDCESHRMHVIKFARESGVRTLAFDYRLAPEHPYPAALEDCVKAYQWLLDSGYATSNIVIGGESAGGTLTFTTLLALKDRGIELPKAGFSISPVTDLRCEAESFEYNAKNDIAPMGSWNIWTQQYIGNSDVDSPYISPLKGDLKGLPPILVCVGTNEIHLDDSINIAKKAESSGVDVTLDIWNNMVHAFPILSPLFPEAKKALTKICCFIKLQLG